MHLNTKFPNIFSLDKVTLFEKTVFEVFRFQYKNISVYHQFCNSINKTPLSVSSLNEIPFLPIDFFKTHRIISEKSETQAIFGSSGTTGTTPSFHHVKDLSIYENSFKNTFQLFYGAPQDYCILALLPSYLERNDSSLVYMVDKLMKLSKHPQNGFYKNDFHSLSNTLRTLENRQQKTLLIGVSFALLDFAQQYPMPLNNTIIMETGGMKGRQEEITREELHRILALAFQQKNIHSEYGMTELLSQAYSTGNGIFTPPPWMKILIRETYDPLQVGLTNKTGGINIIDLANYYSCSFIATQDLGKDLGNEKFEVLGRFDHSDIRGCNLLMN